MMMRMKLYTLIDEFAVVELFGLLTVEKNLSHAQFRRFIEDGGFLDQPFEFWDVDDKCCMNAKIEKFNLVCMRRNIRLQQELGEPTPSPPDYAALEPVDTSIARAFA